MLAKRTYKNQITLPKDVLKDFPGVEYFDVSAKDGKILPPKSLWMEIPFSYKMASL